MSLISDTDYLIHRIRLAYLRDAEDPYASRILGLDPLHPWNRYIVTAGLGDRDRWPELDMPQSPDISDDEEEDKGTASALPHSKLRYTQTIMGGKSGALGLRVHGKRASTSKRLSQIQAAAAKCSEPEVSNFVKNGAPVQALEALSTSAPTDSTSKSLPADEGWEPVVAGGGETRAESPRPSVKIQVPTAPEEAPVTNVVRFVPKFTAETEARRRLRIQARRGPMAIPQAPATPLSFDTSSEEEVMPDSGSSSDFGEEVNGIDSMDEGDEFDPEFAATRIDMASDSDVSSMPTSSAPESAAQSQSSRIRAARLSPVTEHRRHGSRNRPANLTLEGSTAANTVRSETAVLAHKKSYSAGMSRSKSDNPTSASHAPSSSVGSVSEVMFAKKKIQPLKSNQSALSSMLASANGSSNPFGELYAAISGRGQPASTNVTVFFPHATNPLGKPMELNVRKDATVEEVVGFALWNYWEEDWLPKLDDGLAPDDPKREQLLSAVGWILRIAEDDGEVDDDFPPPDRMGKIIKFNSDAYAILHASSSQIQQNEVLESKIQRRPSRIMASKKVEKLSVPGLLAPPAGASGSYMSSDIGGSFALSTSLGPSFTHGPPIFLRIRVADNADAVHISTTIPVSAGMYMQEALEMVCRKRKLANPKDYALLVRLPDTTIMVPLDRTVASLQGNRELLLVKRTMLNSLGLNISKEIKTTDPNASIFKGLETPEQQFSSAALDYTQAYKKYTVYRKVPMLVTRQERTLAIDGGYIHIMPTTNKAKNVFDHGKTNSYHIKSIADCQQSAKSSAFKLILTRGSRNKRYDFEAENPKTAAEIVHTIKSLKTALERTNTVQKSRRSRHVV